MTPWSCVADTSPMRRARNKRKMQQPPPRPPETLVLRAWVERHEVPLRVRIVRFAGSEETGSTVVYLEKEVLAMVAEWLREWSDYGHDRSRSGS